MNENLIDSPNLNTIQNEQIAKYIKHPNQI